MWYLRQLERLRKSPEEALDDKIVLDVLRDDAAVVYAQMQAERQAANKQRGGEDQKRLTTEVAEALRILGPNPENLRTYEIIGRRMRAGLSRATAFRRLSDLKKIGVLKSQSHELS